MFVSFFHSYQQVQSAYYPGGDKVEEIEVILRPDLGHKGLTVHLRQS